MKKNKDASEGLKNVTTFLMSLIGNPSPKNPTQYKTNNIEDDYKIRYEHFNKYLDFIF